MGFDKVGGWSGAWLVFEETLSMIETRAFDFILSLERRLPALCDGEQKSQGNEKEALPRLAGVARFPIGDQKGNGSRKE